MVTVDEIVTACIELYKTLPKKGKPKEKEWTVISAVVAVFNETEIRVLSLGTGSKCIGASLMSPKGDILNDSHAEVIARRAFLRYLYFQIISFNNSNSSDLFYKAGDFINIKDSVKFYFVTSMSPCGDASIMPKDDDSTKASSDFETPIKRKHASHDNFERDLLNEEFASKKIKAEKDALSSSSITLNNVLDKHKDIHRTGAKCLAHSSIQDSRLPGVLYHSVGAVRTKPGRGDPTLSASCSDKIARWNSVGWQGALLSFFIKKPIFMDAIICGSGCPFSKESFNRAVNDRINGVKSTPIFQSRITFPDIKIKENQPCPSSIIWCSVPNKELEVAVNGRKQGVTKKNIYKISSRTSICKKELFLMFELTLNSYSDPKNIIENIFANGNKNETLKEIEYGKMKSMAEEYQRKWTFLRNEYFKVWCKKPCDLTKFNLL